MRVAIFADETRKKELLSLPAGQDLHIDWFSDHTTLPGPDYDAIINLRDDVHPDVSIPDNFPSVYIVNAVKGLPGNLPATTVRINAWPTFLSRKTTEATGGDDAARKTTSELFALLGRDVQWVPDIKGMVSARIIAGIINEAFFSLQEKITTMEDIDTAMKLGTNYPYGPFEWVELIGPLRVYNLLLELSEEDERYTPSLLLRQKALA